MSPKQWVFDPNSGGIKITDAVKRRTEERIRRYAEAHFAGRYTRLNVRFRGQFCYLDAYTEPAARDSDWNPPGREETREEFLERLRNTPTRLFRLRYSGDEEGWGLAFYSYAHEQYELSVYPSGEFFGTPEVALQTVGELHL